MQVLPFQNRELSDSRLLGSKAGSAVQQPSIQLSGELSYRDRARKPTPFRVGSMSMVIRENNEINLSSRQPVNYGRNEESELYLKNDVKAFV